ncbi:MAG: hypothetical protein ACRDZQ_03285 [Acidimicrobiales bacterium]
MALSAESREGAAWGWLPALAVVVAAGLLMVAVADTGGRSSAGWALALFWAGLVVIFAPVAARLASAQASTAERIGLVVVLGVGLYLVKVLHEPAGFTFHDELGFWRSTDSILRTGHLYHPNPIVGSYPFYPGLQIVTDALSKVSGMSIFQAGTVIVGAARLVLSLALFFLFDQAVDSPRLGGLAAMLYMTNPNFVFFDAAFAYESVAIPLAAVALVVIARHVRGGREGRGFLGPLVVLLVFAVVTFHHMTSFALAGFLVLWTAGAALLVGRGRLRVVTRLTWVAAVAVAAVLAWLFLVAGRALAEELLPVANGIIAAAGHLLSTHSTHKRLFHSTSGQADALWAQAAGFASVGLVLLAIPVGIWRTWLAPRRRPLAVILGLVGLVYVATLALRLTSAGTETSNRASEFVFFGLALVVALALVGVGVGAVHAGRAAHAAGPAGAGGTVRSAGVAAHPAGAARAGAAAPWARGSRAWPGLLAVGALSTVLLLGGVTIGWPPYERVPGPYLPAAASRSVGPEGVADAWWARRHLGTGHFVAADETQALLWASYGGENPQTGKIDGLPVADLFFSTSWSPDDRRIIEGDKIRYVVVDSRLSRATPLAGDYFGPSEPGAGHHRSPIPALALAKFDRAPRLSRLLDSGAIVVYGTPLARGGARYGREAPAAGGGAPVTGGEAPVAGGGRR